MTQVMNFITQYNALIIQIIFSVVLILVLVYIYRTFFLTPSATGSIESDAELGEVNKKLNILLQQQKNPVFVSAVMSGAEKRNSLQTESAATSPAIAQEMDQLKTEVLKLRNQLNESEKKVFEMAPSSPGSAAAASSSMEEAFGVGVSASSPGGKMQIEELTQKVEQLQSRLSEYDIIADDIAELSELRSENSALKKKLSASDLVSTSESQPAEAQPDPEVSVEQNVSIPIADLGSSIDELFIDLNVDESEKNLMNDFEKSTKKG